MSLSGKVDWFGRKLVMQSPDFEKVASPENIGNGLLHTGRLVPVYPETSLVSSKWLRNRISHLLAQTEMVEFLPENLLSEFDLPNIAGALSSIHFPKTPKEAELARHRFAFEELFLLHLTVFERKKAWSEVKVNWEIKIPEKEVAEFISSLPFELTFAQKRAVEELLFDLKQKKAMNRLLEGDVGTGKTVVAALGAFVVAKNGLQTAVMAPTQILANQHYNTLRNLLEPYRINVELITGDKSSASMVKNSSRPGSAKPDVIVGTHALLHSRAKRLIHKLAFVVVDEQHKFGVQQRASLLENIAHILTMTATPIPRTVALSLYGDLDLSILDEMPMGRQKITTWLVPPQKREGAYRWIEDQIKSGSQAFIVCPLIEESEVETMKGVKAATAEFKHLSHGVFPNLKLGLLHGRMKGDEKENTLEKFRKGKTDILVSTPVVEVGIDIPNATIMMVEAADRIGLSQLHQLRGRVGRGNKKSYCLLFTELPSPKVLGRLQAMEEAKTGAELAELDLRLRGPGELFGTKQHGFTQLKVASFSDLRLIHKTRDAAEKFFPRLEEYPELLNRLKTHPVVPN